MKTIEFKSNYGNFAYSLTATIGEDVNEETSWLAETQGLGNLAYRVCGSAVDKALEVKTKEAKFDNRKDVPYGQANLDKINAAVTASITKIVADKPIVGKLNMKFAVTGQHVFGESSDAPTKEATELWTTVQGKQGEAFTKALKVLGLKEDDYTDESGVLACKRFLQDAKRKAKEAAVSALG